MTDPLPMNVSRRAALATIAGTFTLRASAQPATDVFTGFPGTEVRFADVALARSVLSATDDYVRATSDFQRRAVMGVPGPVSLDEFSRWNGTVVRPWRDAERARWMRALDELAPTFVPLRIPLPSVVHLIATTGQESAGAPYTRAGAVVLAGAARTSGYTDAMLLAHELWHVASRHAPATADRLYAELGFRPMPALQFPAAWASIRIANPDAPTNAHAMRLSVDGRTPWVTPVLVASRTTLSPGETFFDVMQVRLLEVTPGVAGEPSRAAPDTGELRWHPLSGAHDYLRQLGGNTGYVIHPEEAVADNMVLLAAGGRVRNPALLARLREALSSN